MTVFTPAFNAASIEVRRRRAALKQQVRTFGPRTLACVLNEPALRTTRVWDALGWLAMHPKHRHDLLADCFITNWIATFGDLDDDQLSLLAYELERKAR